ncbi:MAG: hypothetical protein ACLRJV_20750 [Eubacteriales bacterium]
MEKQESLWVAKPLKLAGARNVRDLGGYPRRMTAQCRADGSGDALRLTGDGLAQQLGWAVL